MFKEAGIAKGLMILLAAIPLAIFSGYFLAKGSFGGYALIFILLLGLAFPLVMDKHYWVTVAAVNSTLLLPFFPGQPEIVLVMSAFTVFTLILNRTMMKTTQMVWVPSVSYALLAMAGILIATAYLRGGIGGRALGSDLWGAKRYLGVLGAILVYFALTSRTIPRRYALLSATVFFASGLLSASSNVIFALGEPFYFFFWFFPVKLATLQYQAQGEMVRLSGVTFAMWAVVFTLGVRYGIRGISDVTRPWRLILFLGAIAVSLLGGYRSSLVVIFFVFSFQFLFEGLLRSRLLIVYTLLGMLGAVFLVAFIDQMPLSVQRSVSFLPIDIDPIAKMDAANTLDWRLQIWKTVLPEVPKYLLLGKGYSFSGTDYLLVQEAINRGAYNSYEHVLISGNYHSGILTILIPFGVWGMLAFLWFSWAGFRVLYQAFKNGPKELIQINTFLLSFFCGYWVYYFFLYGQFDLEFMKFAAVIGLSIALNDGVWTRDRRAKALEEEEDSEDEDSDAQPSFGGPFGSLAG